MATLQVRDIDDKLYEALKIKASIERRSLSQEVIKIIEDFLSLTTYEKKDATEEFLKLSGAWQDNRSEKDIVEDIRASRKNSPRFGEDHGLFDWYWYYNLQP